jgi:group I intron endonuclease
VGVKQETGGKIRIRLVGDYNLVCSFLNTLSHISIAMAVIYKATNKTNGKVYIGYDSAWPKRKYIHLWEAKSKAQGVVFHQAIKKYGESGFDWTIEYESPDKDFVLNIMEGYLIRLYDSHYSTGNGYNMSYGGEGQLGFRHSPETIARFKRRITWNRGLKTGPQPKERAKKAADARRGKPRGPYKGNASYCAKWVSRKHKMVQP